MSAYICNPEQFGALAAFAAVRDSAIREWSTDSLLTTAQAVAKGLARENIRSVATRYPDDVSGSRPGPCLLDEEIEEAAAIYAAFFVKTPFYMTQVTHVQILTMCMSLDYQSCETSDWVSTNARRQLDWIRDAAVRELPGYKAADWSFNLPIPEIEALYESKTA